MKAHSLLVQVSAGVALGFLSLGLNSSHAASAPSAQNADISVAQSQPFQTIRWEEEKREKLRHAYYLLDNAKADYHGHRVEAMHAIKKAAEVLGMELHGHPHPEESQWSSDRKLREARTIMQDLQSEAVGKEHDHVNRAVTELDKALEVR